MSYSNLNEKSIYWLLSSPIVFCSLFFSSENIFASTKNIPVSLDTEVVQNLVTDYGSAISFIIGNSTYGEHRAYLKFNLSEIPTGATITKAELYCYGGGFSPYSFYVDAYRASSYWDEDSSWPGGSYTGGYYSRVQIINDINAPHQFRSWDITSLVKNWFNRTYDNYGVCLRASVTEKHTSFYTRDTTNSSRRPYCKITYTPQEADLALQNLTVTRPTNTAARTFTACSFDIKNNGPAALSSEFIMVDFYLSTDIAFGNSDDRKIGDIGFTESIPSGGTLPIALISTGLSNMYRFWVPGLVQNDNYYVFAKVRITDGSPIDSSPNNDMDRTDSRISYTGEIALDDAVDASGFSLIATGSAWRWFGQTTTYYYGGDAAQSADIDDGGESYMYINVDGPGTIQFYWKVSSESGYDYLEFYDETNRLDRISGSVGWASKEFDITTPGLRRLEWKYTKNGSVSSGSDCGWVDYVRWTEKHPDIRIKPTTLNFEIEGSQSIAMSSVPVALDISDPDIPLGTVADDEIIIRFRKAEAGVLHANKTAMQGQDKSELLSWPKTDPSVSAPEDILELRPFVSGANKAKRLSQNNQSLNESLMAGKTLNQLEIQELARNIEEAAVEFDPIGLFYAKVNPGTDIRDICIRLSNRSDVVYAHPSPVYQKEAAPNDTLYDRMWNLDRIGMPEAWDISGNTLGGIRVCVIDTGVRINHAELTGRTADEVDVYTANGDAYSDTNQNNDDPNGHGTSCAGIIAAIRNNSSLIAGIAPVTIIPVNGAIWDDEENEWDITNYTDGVYWGVDHGADVISLSFGGYRTAPYQCELDAAGYAEDNNVVVCAAAGNDDGDADNHYPSAIPYYICVAAVDDDDERVTKANWWWGSNYGDTVDICAPGQGDVGTDADSILTLDCASNTALSNSFNGTSAATPHVAGLCALLRHVNPTLTADQIRDIVEDTAEDQIGDPAEDTAGWDEFYGYGLINAEAAIAAASQKFTIYNDGLYDLVVNAITKENDSDWLIFSPSAPFTIAHDGSQVVYVSVDMNYVSEGSYSDRLLVYSNDPDENPYPGGVYVNLTVICDPPTIQQHPQDLTVCEGQDATFNITASGSGLQYQWKKGGANVGNDSTTLTLSNVQLEDNRSQVWCVITNGCGSSVTSSPASLTVYPWPTVTVNPNPDRLNAPWTLRGPDGYIYSSTGDQTLSGMEIGDYEITWNAIQDWNAPVPNSDTKTLSFGNSINFIGNYHLMGDVNNDYCVEGEDLLILANQWLQAPGTPSADIAPLPAGDNIINLLDYSIIAEHWLEEISNEPEDIIWVYINDLGVSGHEPFNGYMSKYETTNAQYCQYLNAAKADDLITVYTDNKVYATSDKHMVRYIGQVINTDLGRVMRDADYLMKKWAVGTENPGIEGFKSPLDYAADAGMLSVGAWSRFWFVPKDMQFRRSDNMLLFEGGRMTVQTEYMFQGFGSGADPANQKFADTFTEKYDEIAQKYPVYQELYDYAKMVSLAKYLKDSGVPLFWFIMANKDLVITEDSISTVDALIKNSKRFEGVQIEGGVELCSQGQYIYDNAAIEAINTARANMPSESRRRTSSITADTSNQTIIDPVSFTMKDRSLTVLPQHSASSGKDYRGLRYQTDFAVRESGYQLTPKNCEKLKYEIFRLKYAKLLLDASDSEGNLPATGVDLIIEECWNKAEANSIEIVKNLEPLINKDIKSKAKFLSELAKYMMKKEYDLWNEVIAEYAYYNTCLELVRCFNPNQKTTGDFGPGWNVMVPYQIKPANKETVEFQEIIIPKKMALVNKMSGKEEVLSFDADKFNAAAYVPEDIKKSQVVGLFIMTDGSFRLLDKIENEFEFNGVGYLTDMIFSERHIIHFEYQKNFAATLEKPPYKIERAEGKWVKFRTIRLPEKLKIMNLVDGTSEEMVFTEERALVGYEPIDPNNANVRFLALMNDLSYRMLDKNENELLFNQSGVFQKMISTSEEYLVESMSSGNYKVKFGYSLNKNGKLIIAQATLEKEGKSDKDITMTYAYGADGCLSKAEVKGKGTKVTYNLQETLPGEKRHFSTN